MKPEVTHIDIEIDRGLCDLLVAGLRYFDAHYLAIYDTTIPEAAPEEVKAALAFVEAASASDPVVLRLDYANWCNVESVLFRLLRNTQPSEAAPNPFTSAEWDRLEAFWETMDGLEEAGHAPPVRQD